MVLALVAVTAVLGASQLRGFIALFLGLTIGLVGIDSITGQPRLTFGMPQLADGIDIVVVAVGIFAVGEALWVAAHLRRTPARGHPGRPPVDGPRATGSARGSRGCAAPRSASRSARCPPAARRSRPSCPTSPRRSCRKHPEEFGKGAIEGVAGPEAANNASAAGTLVPLLALGLPDQRHRRGHAGRASELRHPARPAAVRRTSRELVWALIASLFIGNTLLLVLNLPLAPLWAKLLQIPRPYLYAGHPVLRHAWAPTR